MNLPAFQTPQGAKNPGNPILEAGGRELEMALLAPFHADFVDWKPGPGKEDSSSVLVFPYIDADAIRARLNEVCGIGGWQGMPYKISEGQLGFALAIWINGQWLVKADGAFAGDLDLGNVDDAHYQKEADRASKDAKGAISNALKRAGMCWGMGQYLKLLSNSRHPGKVYEEVRKQGNSKVLTDDAIGRLYDLAAKPYYDHHGALAARHEAAAKRAFDAGELATAHGAAKAAYLVRHNIFGPNDDATKAARAFLEMVVGRQKAAETGAAPTPATAPSSSAPDPELVGVVASLKGAPTADDAKKIATGVWKRWAADSDEGRTFRATFEAAMQRFVPGWTIAAAEAEKAKSTRPTTPTQAGVDGGAPPAARAPAGPAPGAPAPAADGGKR